jgi:hypothetical protein
MGGVEVWIHSFLTSELGEVANLTPCHLIPRIETWYPLNSKLSGPQIGRVGRFGEEIEYFLLPIFELRTIQPVA